MATLVEKFFDDKDALTAELSATLEQSLRDGIKNDGRAVLMVSGGSSPAPAYKHLSTLDLDWQNVDVAMVDERWVDADQSGSNETFISNNLLINNAATANYIGMKGPEASAILGQSTCEQRYQQLAAPFDLTLLGMGHDGHTASLFPQAQGLEAALDAKNKNICNKKTVFLFAVKF